MPAPLRVDRPSDGVVLLTLDLPDRRNAMTEELTAAWVEAMASLRTDRTVRAVVVTGAGQAFCSGGDLSWIEAGDPDGGTPDRLRDKMRPFYLSWLAIRELEVPTIAAVNGAAIGAGLCLALACDMRWAAPRAKLGVPFSQLGMHPGMAATFLLPEAVGLPRARELFFTGRIVEAEEAAAIGLVNGVIEADALLDTVLATAARIASAAPVPNRLTKVALQQGPRSFRDALEWEALAQPVTMAGEDLLEGIRAQREKRAPVFRGR